MSVPQNSTPSLFVPPKKQLVHLGNFRVGKKPTPFPFSPPANSPHTTQPSPLPWLFHPTPTRGFFFSPVLNATP
ncbi:hypothetical protein, partial [Enterococcus faecium]